MLLFIVTKYFLNSQSICDGLEGAPGRAAKATSPKVAVNPLQFVKVGPCDLYRSAQEQLKKVEEIKKAKKEQKDDIEDWQSVCLYLIFIAIIIV